MSGTSGAESGSFAHARRCCGRDIPAAPWFRLVAVTNGQFPGIWRVTPLDKDPRHPDLKDDWKVIANDWRAARATGTAATSTWKSGKVGLKL